MGEGERAITLRTLLDNVEYQQLGFSRGKETCDKAHPHYLESMGPSGFPVALLLSQGKHAI